MNVKTHHFGCLLAFSNRSRFDIIASILDKANTGAKKTWLLYAANLSFGQHQEYLKTLMDLGLMVREDDIYTTTDKGREFLENYRRLLSTMVEPADVQAE